MKLLYCALFTLFALAGYWLQNQIPFYAAWDMDFITVNDLYRLKSGLIPQHINHTAFGMYLPMRWIWEFLPLEAHDLSTWLSFDIPLLPLSEAVVWLRYTSVAAATILIMSTWSSFGGVSLILALGTLPSLWLIPMQIMRTELWSIMWYALAFATIPYIKSQKTLLFVFVLAALGFITKYQGLFLHLGLLLILVANIDSAIWPKLPKRRIALSCLSLFLFLSLCAAISYIPSSFAIFSRSSAPNIFFLAALLVLILPLIRSPWLKWSGILWWAGIGLILVFGLHFFMGLNFKTSWEYLLFDWRMIFMRHSNPNIALARSENIFLDSLRFHIPLLFIWSLLLINQWRGFVLKKKIIIGLYTALIIISLRYVTRGGIQDAIWNDFLILFGLSLFNLRNKKIVSFSFILISIFQIYQLRELPFQKVFAGQNDIDRYWIEPYESPEVLYTEKMRTLENRRDEINQMLLKKKQIQ